MRKVSGSVEKMVGRSLRRTVALKIVREVVLGIGQVFRSVADTADEVGNAVFFAEQEQARRYERLTGTNLASFTSDSATYGGERQEELVEGTPWDDEEE
jgi:hypothetical protein